MTYTITSKNNSHIKDLIKLYENKEKNNKKLFLVFSLDLIKLAYNKGLLKEVYATSDLGIDVPSYIISKELLDYVNKNDESIEAVGVVNYFDDSLIKSDKVLYLDDVSDPNNLGTIILLADHYGYKDILLSANSALPYNEKCIFKAQEHFFNVRLHLNAYDDLLLLKEKGYQIITTGLKSSILLKEVKPHKKHVVVMGNEAHGVSEKVFNISDEIVRIDISNVDSLNVAIATGIVLDAFK